MGFDLNKFAEYIVAGCISSTILIIALLVVFSLFLGSVVESVTQTIVSSVERQLNEIEIDCETAKKTGSVQITIAGENYYCEIKS